MRTEQVRTEKIFRGKQNIYLEEVKYGNWTSVNREQRWNLITQRSGDVDCGKSWERKIQINKLHKIKKYKKKTQKMRQVLKKKTHGIWNIKFLKKISKN